MAAGLPTSVVTEIELTPGVWTAVTTSVIGDSIEIDVGKDAPGGDLRAGTLDLDLDNFDGTYTPDNPLSTYFPNFTEGKRVRVKVTKGAATSVRSVGRIVTIEPDFPDEPTQCRTHISAIDVLGDLARRTLPPALLAKLQADYAASGEVAPVQSFWYWPLRGGYRLLDSVTGIDSLTYYQPTTGGEVQWDSDSSFPLGGDACLSLTAGVGLRFNYNPHISPLADRLGVAVNLQAGAAGMVLGWTDKQTAAADVSGFVAWWDGAGVLSFREYLSGTPTTLASVAAAPGWHTVSLRNADFEVDGVATAVAPTGVAPFGLVTVGGLLNLSVRDLFMNSGDSLASYLVDTGASLATITAQVAIQLNLTALGSALAWTSSVAGIKAVPPATEGRTGLEVLADLANSQSGIAYVAYSSTDPQTIVLVANKDARDIVVAATLDPEVDLQGGPTLDRNIYDKVATATARNPFQAVTITDDTLVDTFGSSTAEISTVLSHTNDLAAAASALIAAARSSKLRLSETVLDLATSGTDHYADFFALTQGARVRVSPLPSTYFGVTRMDGFVLGWTERPGITGYEVALRLLAADAPAEARYDDSTYGRYGWADGAATGTGGTAIGGTGNGTLVITTPSGPCLTVAAGSYPLQLDWNGECVTITSAPASSTSPQTVTITARGQNGTVARVHAAGEPVDIWQSARFAL